MNRFYTTEKLSDNMQETPEGYLLCLNVPITRVGEFLYKGNELLGQDGKPLVESGDDGIVRIQRDEDAVFDENTLKSFEGKPFTLDHPKGFVGPENWPDLAHGTTQNIRRGEGNQKDLVLADILVTTEEAIELIKSGQREISCGYDAEYEQIEKGIGRQVSIIGNHVALVSKGRAGSRCAIVDSAECTGCGVCTCGKNKTEKQEESMKLKDKFMKWLDACPIKDEDEDLDEKRKKEEEEAAAAKDKKTKDEGDDRLAAVESRLDRIENLLEALLSDDDESEAKDKKTKDDDDEEDDEKKKESEDADEDEDDEKKKKESETEDDDEEEEKKKEEEEKAEVNDAWPDFISKADVIDPGIRLRKPTKDHRKTFDSMKAEVLERACNSGDYGKDVKVLLSGRTGFKHMTSDALDVAFSAAAELIGQKRNKKVQQERVSTKDHKFSEARTIAQINEANKTFYGEQTRK